MYDRRIFLGSSNVSVVREYMQRLKVHCHDVSSVIKVLNKILFCLEHFLKNSK